MPTLSFQAFQPQHLLLLNKWLKQPHVWPWWRQDKTHSFQDFESQYTSYLQLDTRKEEHPPIYPFIIEWDKHPIGYIQYYDVFDLKRERYSVKDLCKGIASLAGLDFYIGEPNFLGRGLGVEILQQFLKNEVFRRFQACLVDPDKNNKTAIKTCAKAGFITFEDLPSRIVMVAQKERVKNPLIILGSSRGDGHTRQAIQAVLQHREVPIIDLRQLEIGYYDYDYGNHEDDFIPLAEKMVKHHPLVLATPVYWYTMSAIMKTFIDRWSDLLDRRKDLGRRLVGQELYVITSYATSYPQGFETAFLATCNYLEMKYKGCFYFYSGNDSQQQLQNQFNAQQFAKTLFGE